MKTITALLFILILQSSLISQNGWFHQSSGTQEPLFSLSFVNSETGYACGYGLILKTTNGGTNWGQLLQDTMHFRAMYFIDVNTGYVICTEDYLYKTSNGGMNWNASYFGAGVYLRKTLFLNDQTGFIITGYGMVLKTVNGALNWNSKSISQTELQDICFLNEQTGYITEYTKIHKTTDQGLSWITQPFGVPGLYFSIYFTDVNTGFAVGAYGKAAKTTNGGMTWDSLNLNTRFTLYSVNFVNNTTGFICGTGLVLKTNNGGSNWYPSLVDTLNYPQLYDMQFVNENTGYIVGHKQFGLSDGIILKTTNGGNIIGVQNISNEVPRSYSLSQNYPNPFNPETIINFQLAVKNNVKLIVYDVVGMEVETLVNQELNEGSYKVEWIASNYPSGVYYYKLTAGDYTETKKMVLVK